MRPAVMCVALLAAVALVGLVQHAGMCSAAEQPPVPDVVVPDINYEVYRHLHQLKPKSVLYHGCHFIDSLKLMSLPAGADSTPLQMSIYCDAVCSGRQQQPVWSSNPQQNGANIQSTCNLNAEYDVLITSLHDGSERCLSSQFMNGLPSNSRNVVCYDGANKHVVVFNRTAGSTTPTVVSSVVEASDGVSQATVSETFRTFTNIYTQKLWGADGGGSGLGSTVNYTANVRQIILDVVRKYNISSILDAPCGAMVWMPLVLQQLPVVQYTGLDITCHVVRKHKAMFSRQPRWRFFCADVCAQQLVGADLVFSRDALQHLTLDHTFRFLSQVKASGAKYLMVGSYLKGDRNTDIRVGDYYPINLLKPPFSTSQPLEVFDEATPDGKHMLLYDVQRLTWAGMAAQP